MTSIQVKTGLAIGLLLLATLAGVYFSGFMARFFLGLDGTGMKWWAYLDYVRTIDLPQVRPYAGKIKVAGSIGFGIPMLVYAALLMPILRSGKQSLHGNARFATGRDLARLSMFKPAQASISAVLVGRDTDAGTRNHPLRLARSCALIALR